MLFPFCRLLLLCTERVIQLAQDPAEDPSGDVLTPHECLRFDAVLFPQMLEGLSPIQKDTGLNRTRKKRAGEKMTLTQMGHLTVPWMNRKDAINTSSFTNALKSPDFRRI